MLGDNIHEFINLMDGNGELVFSDRQAHRMERAMANMEFSFGEGGYQPSEFIKRQLPKASFDLLIADEGARVQERRLRTGPGHGVLAKARKTLLLTGTLMGGYGDDLFHLLFRALPGRMIEDGYRPTKSGSMTSAAMAFMRDHGVLKDIYSESTGTYLQDGQGAQGIGAHGQGAGFRSQGRAALRPAVHGLPQVEGHRWQRAAALRRGVPQKSRWTRRRPRPTAIWRVG